MKDIIQINDKNGVASERKCTALLREQYGISNLTVAKWVERKLLPPPTRLGNRNYYDSKRVEELMRDNAK